jgi:uncharacterized protein (TIGR02145 family)
VCAEDEVSGCLDAAADNFNSAATENDGSCIYPGPAQCGGATTVTFDGHTYALVGIGTQCWFAENLRSDNYLNGDSILGGMSDVEWAWTDVGAQTLYGEGSTAVYDGNDDEFSNYAAYGRLYNWYAVADGRGLCPAGFHVPSDAEWKTLELAIGMNSVQVDSTGWRGSNQGVQLKTVGWGGTNSSGFGALPGGIRTIANNGFYHGEGYQGAWWSTSLNGGASWDRHLALENNGISRNATLGCHRCGFSVRCIQD